MGEVSGRSDNALGVRQRMALGVVESIFVLRLLYTSAFSLRRQ